MKINMIIWKINLINMLIEQSKYLLLIVIIIKSSNISYLFKLVMLKNQMYLKICQKSLPKLYKPL